MLNLILNNVYYVRFLPNMYKRNKSDFFKNSPYRGLYYIIPAFLLKILMADELSNRLIKLG